MKNRILSLLMALMLMVVLAVNASAVEMPDLESKGSLTLSMHYNGQPLDSGKVNILAVGDVKWNPGNDYSFQLFASLGKESLTQEEMYSADVAKELLTAAKKHYAANILSASVVDGKVAFQDLNAGLYIVWQEESDACDDLSAFQPFLISVPRWQNDEFVMDVVAAPKVPLLPPKPTEPPEITPPPPELPYTGQLNWPIPVMAVSGGMLMLIGLILCVSRKRNDYEK